MNSKMTRLRTVLRYLTLGPMIAFGPRRRLALSLEARWAEFKSSGVNRIDDYDETRIILALSYARNARIFRTAGY
jgi:hypothetical protein